MIKWFEPAAARECRHRHQGQNNGDQIKAVSFFILHGFLRCHRGNRPLQALQQHKAALEEDAKGLRAELEALQTATAAVEQESTLLAASQREATNRLVGARADVDALHLAEVELHKLLAAAAEEQDMAAMREAKLQVRVKMRVVVRRNRIAVVTTYNRGSLMLSATK